MKLNTTGNPKYPTTQVEVLNKDLKYQVTANIPAAGIPLLYEFKHVIPLEFKDEGGWYRTHGISFPKSSVSDPVP